MKVDSERDLILNPLTVEEIQTLARQAGGIDQLVSTKSPKYKAMTSNGVVSHDWPPLMAAEPRLIKRPLLVIDGQVLVGFDERAWRAALNLPAAEGESR